MYEHGHMQKAVPTSSQNQTSEKVREPPRREGLRNTSRNTNYNSNAPLKQVQSGTYSGSNFIKKTAEKRVRKEHSVRFPSLLYFF
jgi:hypothetical protein